ncbi:hypothetical protein niasHS_001982 [Heterodera schachtii]|uniref:Uncharacterized protein n=1 Tax=Heterodera schachtii TaxID=97005 RepID=A0ABD2K5H6_HETSC
MINKNSIPFIDGGAVDGLTMMRGGKTLIKVSPPPTPPLAATQSSDHNGTKITFTPPEKFAEAHISSKQQFGKQAADA